MIYYPLSNLIMAGINEILVISSPEHIKFYKKLLSDGSTFGLNIKYKIQKPNGIAEALILAESFLDGADMCLILGDNISLEKILKINLSALTIENQSIFVKELTQKIWVLKFDKSKPIKIIEKPKNLYGLCCNWDLFLQQ